MENPWNDRVYRLIREYVSDRTPPTPTAQVLRTYLLEAGQLQVGSEVVPGAGCTWFRPLKGGRWYTDRPVHLPPTGRRYHLTKGGP